MAADMWACGVILFYMLGLEAIGYDFDARHTKPSEAFNGYLFVDATECLQEESDEGRAERDSNGIRLNEPLWEEFEGLPAISDDVKDIINGLLDTEVKS